MSLFDILACPTCKVKVKYQLDSLVCEKCFTKFPIVNGVPVMFPDGSIPGFEHEADLQVRSNYDPWIHRVILQSLLDNQIVLDLGAGNMALDDPCIIRMDGKLSPYVDLVGDAHALPFLPESLDYIFSLAVVEHLRNPFQVAQEMYAALKDGGYIYQECNFVFAYHGYPHHYFNASLQGMEQIFAQFVPLRTGVAPYQMPSFALTNVIQTYLKVSSAEKYPHGRRLTALLRRVLEHDIMDHDIYFTEEGALQVAAGTYFAGVKQKTPQSTLIPMMIQAILHNNPTLQSRFPEINRITSVDNVLTWAKREGRAQYPEISAYLDGLTPFNKRGTESPWSREGLGEILQQEPRYGAVGFDSNVALDLQNQRAETRYQEKKKLVRRQQGPLLKRLLRTYLRQGIRAAIQQWLNYLSEGLTK